MEVKRKNLENISKNLKRVINLLSFETRNKNLKPYKKQYIRDNLELFRSNLLYVNQALEGEEITDHEYKYCISIHYGIFRSFRRRIDGSTVGFCNSGWKNIKRLRSE